VTFIACQVIGSIALADVAAAHVKWFVACEPSDSPILPRAVLTETLLLFSVLFISVFYVACRIEQSAIGEFLTNLLERATTFLRERLDVLLRAVAAISFSLLWVDGTVVLTPELKGNSGWLSAIQLLIPIFLAARAMLPAAAAGIIVVYGYGVASYGLFHMLDYPVFLGLAVYFALSITDDPRIVALRLSCLRWSVALSLLWPAMEKFLYPTWIAPILIEHPELTLGFDVTTVITAAGVVEFGLSFAMLWTPLLRRLGALALAALLIAATFDFGKLDAVGHLMVVAILLAVVAEPGTAPARCRPALAPVVSGAALLAAIFLYSGLHALYYFSWSAAAAPILSGAALLAVIVLYMSGVVHGLLPAAPARVRKPMFEPGDTGDDLHRPLGNLVVLQRGSRAS
jgi:hypothetical protein